MESTSASVTSRMEKESNNASELHYVFMEFDPEYDRLRADRVFVFGTFEKKISLVIVDGFSVEITDDQAKLLRSANGVRAVEKNQEIIP
ncbi:hypothetical protein Syun_019433 [Stephania yunnanensis]|uniref:Inhibitor I9 domain-containing protein n=1 Tax=Stephania yunnanensis TaxID=152371 RepID=A0AAP0IWI4_9MAGN